ncbi:hypothetical protein [Actinoplanes sp. NPDC049265]|uniref:hypothetical protein n=1 Tax=Actinoplanes sp. NPDC049265 TaxID=3363902 RepID=UPI003714850E
MGPEAESLERPALHDAAMFSDPAAVALLIRRNTDVDAMWWGRTALWQAVMAGEAANAQVLFESGADPWRPMMAGWSPGRLALAGPDPDLFGAVPAGVALSAGERAAVEASRRLIDVLAGCDPYASSFGCIAGIDAAEAQRRLGATLLEGVDTGLLLRDPYEFDELETIVGVTEVPGGCVVAQWGSYLAASGDVLNKLSRGTVSYGVSGNPKSGNQGALSVDGTLVGWDLHPGGADAFPDDDADEVLRAYLFVGHPLAYCCARAGPAAVDARAFTGPPDLWLRLPEDPKTRANRQQEAEQRATAALAEAERKRREEQEREPAYELREWGGRRPTPRLRELGVHAWGMLHDGYGDLLFAFDALQPAAQRDAARWLARQAFAIAGLDQLGWARDALDALDRGDPLPAPFDTPDTMHAWVAPDALQVAGVTDAVIDAEPDTPKFGVPVHRPSFALPAVLHAAHPDPLIALVDTFDDAIATFDDYRDHLLAELRTRHLPGQEPA